MPPKNMSIPLPRYMSPVRRRGNVAYKYQRDVPKPMRPYLGRDRWEHYLGSDLTKATAKCAAFTKEHDRIIGLLKNDFPNVLMRGFEKLAALSVVKDLQEDRDSLAITWRDTEAEMERASSMPPRYEREALASLAFRAYGDRSHIEKWEDPTPILRLTLAAPVSPRPDEDDTVGKAMYTAMQGVLNARLAELAGQSKENDAYRLPALTKKYLELHKLSEASVRSYTDKAGYLADFVGDVPVTQITPEMLRRYRDQLIANGLSANSVRQYFSPIKTVMRWAISDDLVPGFDTMPTDKVTMPRITTTVEDTRWVRFDDDEIKRVWKIVQRIWGPGSGYEPHRQEAFKWAFRVALYTAARPVEIFRMKPENVTPDSIDVTETKTKISRRLPLTAHLTGFHEFMQTKGWGLKGKPESAAGTMSDSFSIAIREADFTNDRQVLYSTKDTLVDRLQRAGHSDDVIRGITGHVSGQGQLRNYKTRLNDTPEGLAKLREALDAVTYW